MGHRSIHFALLFYVAFYAICSGKRPFAGPFDVVFKRFYKCDYVGEEAFRYNTKFYKINRTHNAYRTNITSDRGLQDSMQVAFHFSVYGNGGWKDNFMYIRLNKACTDVQKLLPDILVSVYKASGKTFRGCPTTETLLEVRNWMYPLKLASPVFPYGRYKINTSVYENEKVLTCFVFELDMVPQVQPITHVKGKQKKH